MSPDPERPRCACYCSSVAVLASGTSLGPYIVLAPIGAGGMGEVYRARDPRLDREVAVKVLPAELAQDPSRLRRLETEARAAAALNHPNILSVHDVSTEGTPFVVFELLEGQTLRHRMDEGRLSPRQAIEYARAIARGLAAAHDRGIVHRDLKPDNVFVTRDEQIKILDFGLARLGMHDADTVSRLSTQEMTAPGTVIGTPGYMAPEQVRGENVDKRADVFAFGLLLYEMLAGHRAFQRDSAAETMAAILRDAPEPLPADRQPSRSLEQIMVRCLAKRREQRFQSARELASALESLTPASGASAIVAEQERASIAVLPFEDMSPGRDQGYFCDGLAEELIRSLTRLAGVRVASRTSSFRFRGGGHDVRSIGEQLGVKSVVEGSVRKSGDRLRVAVQLSDTHDGYQLWSERYDRELEDVFEVQDEIAENVARALRLVLSDHERNALRGAASANIEAYEFYLRGRGFLARIRSNEVRQSLPMFERAVELDPEFPLAYVGVALAAYWIHAWLGGGPAELARAEHASRKALELAPELAEVHLARGAALSLGGRHEEAASEFEAAIRIDPRQWDAYYLFGRMRFAEGRFEDTERLWKQAMKVRPDDYQLPLLLPMIYHRQGRDEERRATQRHGIALARRHLLANPDDVRAMYLAGGALIGVGEREEGMALLRAAIRLAPGEPSVLYNAACTYARMGEAALALETLESCVRGGWGNRDWMSRDPDFDSLRDDPRFVALLAKAAETAKEG